MSYTMICAIFHILGIYLADYIASWDIVIFSLAGIIICVIAGIIRRKSKGMIILALLMLSVGAVSYYAVSVNKLYEEFPDEYVTTVGTIVSSPMKSSGIYCNKYIVEPETVTLGDKTVKPDKKMYVRTKHPFNYGDIIEFSGYLYKLPGPKNEYDYDYSRSEMGKGIYNQVNAFEVKKIGEVNPISFKYLPGYIKSCIHNAIFYNYGGDTAAMYKAILLGDKSYFSNKQTTRLLKTGVWQSIYSPYIHITILTLIAGMFYMGREKNRLLTVFLIIYALFNIGTPNILKASLLVLLPMGSRSIFGYSDKRQQLALLVLLLTLVNPMLCYSRGFIMSVASTVVLFVFYPVVSKMVAKLPIKNRRVVTLISVAVTLCFCTYPIAAHLFGGTAVYGTVISLILMPVIVALYILSLIYVPMLVLSVPGGIIEKAVDVLVKLINQFPDYVEAIPFHYISSRTPEIPQVIVAYMIMWLCMRLVLKKRDAMFRFISALTLVCMIGLVIISVPPALKIYFVNVGQGDSSILRTSDGETVLIDGGGAAVYSDSDYNVGDRVLVPYMVSHGINRVDYAVVTHFHKDHAEGVVSVLENFPVENIIMPDSLSGDGYRPVIESLAKEKGVNIIYASIGGGVSLDSGLRLSFLAPDDEQRLSREANENSIVTRVDYYEFCGIFTGDSNDVVDEDYPRNVDILKVAHHGSDSASTESDITYLSPRFGVISVGEHNTYGLPDESVLDNLNKVNTKVFRTDINGDIQFEINKNGDIKYKTLR